MSHLNALRSNVSSARLVRKGSVLRLFFIEKSRRNQRYELYEIVQRRDQIHIALLFGGLLERFGEINRQDGPGSRARHRLLFARKVFQIARNCRNWIHRCIRFVICFSLYIKKNRNNLKSKVHRLFKLRSRTFFWILFSQYWTSYIHLTVICVYIEILFGG